jgi:hypothetical protein
VRRAVPRNWTRTVVGFTSGANIGMHGRNRMDGRHGRNGHQARFGIVRLAVAASSQRQQILLVGCLPDPGW